jgi:hypothetical protein
MKQEYSGRLPITKDVTDLFSVMINKPCYIFNEGDFWDIRTTDGSLVRTLHVSFGIKMEPRAKDNIDTKTFGNHWQQIRTLFQDAFQLSLRLYLYQERSESLSALKVIHCMLNILGYSREDEIVSYHEWSVRHYELSKGKIINPVNQRGIYNI